MEIANVHAIAPLVLFILFLVVDLKKYQKKDKKRPKDKGRPDKQMILIRPSYNPAISLDGFAANEWRCCTKDSRHDGQFGILGFGKLHKDVFPS
jgi:hypothetical protein